MRDDAEEITRRAYETLARLDEADRKRALEQWQRGPVDDVVPAPIADYRDCRSTREMSTKQFAAWCDAGKPALTARVAMVPKAKADDLVRAAVGQERAHVAEQLEGLAKILGEEVAIIENKLRADFEAKLAALRAEISKAQRVDDDGIIDLPAWRSDVLQH